MPAAPGSKDDAPHLLVVDDDQRLRDLLRKYLSSQGYRVSVAIDAADARGRLKHLDFDAIILDLMMPGESGLEFASKVRAENPVPILMLTAMGEPQDRIAGLEEGADDYVTKPFEPKELLLRIRNVLRRRAPEAPVSDEIRLGDAVFWPARGELVRDGRPVRLTLVEAALLGALAAKPGQVCLRDDLAAASGGPVSDDAALSGRGRAVDVQVTRLRKKVEPDPKIPRYIKTVRGKGYLLNPD